MLESLSPLHLLVPLVAIQRVAELRIARRNDAWLRAQGAVEYGAEHYRLIVAVHVLWFAGLVVESIIRGGAVSRYWAAYLALFLLGQLLRTWAIRTLGRRWTTRVLVIPGLRPITAGPYRYLRHPNYVAVVIELAALPLVFDAHVTAAAVSLLNAAVLAVRIRVESRALGVVPYLDTR